MVKNTNLDLSCLDDDDMPMVDAEVKAKAVQEAKELQKIAGLEQAFGQVAGSEPRAEPEIAGSTKGAGQEVAGSGELEGGQSVDLSTVIL